MIPELKTYTAGCLPIYHDINAVENDLIIFWQQLLVRVI